MNSKTILLERNKQIDSLRAFSFILVFLYHSKILEAGYIGVDLFFLLSGYLMTLSINQILEREGAFGIFTFFNKRIARLIPSILVLVCSIFFFSYLIIPDFDRGEILRTGLSTLIMLTNYYLAITQDYFGVSAIFNPFTHMWSIAAEIHFYIIIGFLGFIFKFRATGWFLISFILILSLFIFKGDSAQTYLFTHTRVFSFFIGSILFFLKKNLRLKFKNSLIVILLLYLLIALSSTIKLPNIFIGMDWLTNSIVANVFGFVLLILITDYNNETKTYTASNKIYSFWIYIGRISYSLYLFHYPIISFSFWLWGDLSFFPVCIIFLISIGIAGVNFKYVESKYYSQLYLKSKNT